MNRLDALTGGSMDSRLLTGAVAALLGLIAVTAVQVLVRDVTWTTPVGLIAPIDLVGLFAAMALGGYVARQWRFRWLAFALQLVAMVCTMAAYMLFDTGMPDAMRAPGTLLRLNGLSLVLSLLVAFAGAVTGEALALRSHAGSPDGT